MARTEGPQLITRQDKEGVVMIPLEHFDQLVARSHQPESLVRFFRESPLVGVNLDLVRDKDTGRDFKLRAGSCSTPTASPNVNVTVLNPCKA